MCYNVHYESKTTFYMDGFGGGKMSKNRKKRIDERMKGTLEITYFLAF
jgi:hypothetical protein